jgi:hypothetical protein
MQRRPSFIAASGWAWRPQRSISGSTAAWSREGLTMKRVAALFVVDEWNSAPEVPIRASVFERAVWGTPADDAT